MGLSELASQYDETAEYYDYVIPYRERADVDFFVDLARESGGPALELGCGTGRVLAPTALAGVTITGLDASSAMLEHCKAKVAALPADAQSRVTLVHGDMRSFRFSTPFALATFPFRPFQHLLTVEDQLACLASVRNALAPGGRVVIDVFNPALELLARADFDQEFGDEPTFVTPDGRRVERRVRIASRSLADQTNDIELIYYVEWPTGRRERLTHTFPMRYFFRFELEHLLVRAGFEIENLFGDYDRTPFGMKRPGEIIFVARKR